MQKNPKRSNATLKWMNVCYLMLFCEFQITSHFKNDRLFIEDAVNKTLGFDKAYKKILSMFHKIHQTWFAKCAAVKTNDFSKVGCSITSS